MAAGNDSVHSPSLVTSLRQQSDWVKKPMLQQSAHPQQTQGRDDKVKYKLNPEREKWRGNIKIMKEHREDK